MTWVSTPRIEPAGDLALVVTVGDRQDVPTSRRTAALAAEIRAAGVPGVVEAVPGTASVTVHIDPDSADRCGLVESLAALAGRVLSQPSGADAGRRWTIPVCYDGALAPDLAMVAERSGLSPAEVVSRHAGAEYHVYMLGFLPGFPYMGDLDPRLRLPRRGTPRTVVPKGAVAIAGSMTAIYPLESPGGWHIVGRSPVPLFDLAADPPALLAAGDVVRLRPVSAAEFERLSCDAAAGRLRLTPEPSTRGAVP